MKKQMKSVITLFSICAVIAVLLAATNSITMPFIQRNEERAVQKALLEVLPEGNDFQEVDISSIVLPPTVTKVYREQGGGYVFQLKTAGYSTGMILLCGVNSQGSVTGAVCLSSSETLGYEKTFGERVIGKDRSTIATVDTVSGATKTTQAYKAAVTDALAAYACFKGQP